MGINPVWYETLQDRLDTTVSMVKADIEVWQCIKEAKKDYVQNGDHGYYEPSDEKFMAWLKELWGIEIKKTDMNHYSVEYKIVADDKYTMFMLKYSK